MTASNTRTPAANAPGAESNARRRRRAFARAMIASLVLLGSVVVALPTVVVLLVGLLPAFTWFVVDVTPGRYAFRCIAAFNLAGLAPSLDRLWHGANDLPTAVAIIADPASWLVFMCAAGGGWLAFHSIPAAVSFALSFSARRRIEALRAEQRDLEEEWGAAVAGPGAAEQPGAPAPLRDHGLRR